MAVGTGTVTPMAPSARARLEIRLLGPPEILIDGRPLAVDTRKAVAILALLAADGRPYARDELAALLWPESDDMAARGALRRTLSTMRAVVDDGVLRIDRSRVDLDRAQVRVDLVEIERAATSDDRRVLTAAADRIRGPFMAGFNLRDSPEFDDWRAARAVAAERSVLAVLDRLALAAEADGDLGGAIGAAGRRLDLDPLDESGHVRLMDLLAVSGDRAAAMRQYRACVAILERELGVLPLASTTARYELIRDEEPVAPAPVVAPATVVAVVPLDPMPQARPDGPPLLVGREGVMQSIEAAIAATGADGHGRVIALTGEAGIGKTRLGDVVAHRILAAGGTVLAARGHRGESAIAYGAVVDLLRAAMREPAAVAGLATLEPGVRAELARLVPALDRTRRRSPGSAAGDATAHARLVGAIVDGLAILVAGASADVALGALWIDDLHWVDAASLEVLAVLARRLADRPMLLVMAWRDEDVPTATAAVLGALAAEATTRFALDRLTADAVDALVDRLGPSDLSATERARIGEAAEGLPLYLVEALAAAGSTDPAPVPPGVRAVLRARLETIDETAAQVLAAAAIIGRTFDVATVRHASGRSEEETVDALDRLVARAIVREGPAGYDFAHGALRDIVDEGIGLGRRRLLHQRVAEALRLDVGALGRDDLGRRTGIAIHEREAGRTTEAAEAYLAAATRAAEVFANHTAIDHAAAALALGHPDAIGLHALIGRARTRLGDYGGAVAAFEAAAARATPSELPAIEWEIGRARLRRGDLAGADRHLATAVEGGAASPAVEARVWVDRSVIRRRSGDVPGAVEAARRALAVADAAADAPAVGAARRMLGLCALDADDPVAAIAELSRAVQASAADPDPSSGIAALVGLALATAAAGDIDVALAHGAAALADCRRIGDRHLEAAVENHLGDLLHAAGRDDDARDHQRRAAAAFAELGGDPADPDPGIWMLAAW